MRFNLNKLKTSQLVLFFILLSFVLFGSSLRLGFLSDDWHWLWLAKNTDWSWHIFLTNYEGNNFGGSYNPFLLVLFKLSFSLFHQKAFFYHALSLLVHSLNAYLVYLLAQNFLSNLKLSSIKNWSILSAVLFLAWPSQVETVTWLASWPHLWVTTFYLASFYFYLRWREKYQNKFLFLSLVLFFFSLLIKELAITLPFLLIWWEIYFYSVKQKNKKLSLLFCYFAILAIWLYLRFLATALFFGYYGQSQLNFRVYEWFGNLVAYFNDFFTFSYLRVFFYKVYYYGLEYLVIFSLAILALYFWTTYFYKKWWHFTAISSVILILLPLTPLGLHRLSFSGERYLYLASAFFVVWLVIILRSIFLKDNKYLKLFLIILFLIIIPTVFYKNFIWSKADKVAKNIVTSFADLNTMSGDFISVALPDNLDGAEVFRNNLQQALELSYPDYHGEIHPLPSYIFLNAQNYDQKLFKWRADDLGWFLESVDGSFVFTGQTSIIVNNVYFELWNYNYQNYTSNIIRLMPRDDLKEKLLDSKVKWLSFEEGRLEIH